MHLFLPTALFKDHPEYFAMINGKRRVNRHGSAAAHLCMTNPEVVKIVARNAVRFLKKEKKPAEIISISQNDGGKGFCQCEKCAEMTRREGITILMTTHDVGLMGAADMIIELENGVRING